LPIRTLLIPGICLALVLIFFLLCITGLFAITRDLYPLVCGGSLLLLIPAEITALKGLFTIRRIPRGSAMPIATALLFCLLGMPILLFVSIANMPVIQPPRPPYLHLYTSIRYLSIASAPYAAAHAGHFPPHPAILILDGTLDPRYIAHPGTPPYTPPTPLPPLTDWPLIAPDVDAHSAFVYTGADLVVPLLPGPAFRIVLAYSKPSPLTPNHRVLLFADGHSEYIPDADLPATFATSNAARAKLGLPPFTLDGPPPPPTVP
jgi:hypothetical protein